MTFLPTTFTKAGYDTQVASTIEDYYQLLWEGWNPGDALPGPPRSEVTAHLSDLDDLAAADAADLLDVNNTIDGIRDLSDAAFLDALKVVLRTPTATTAALAAIGNTINTTGKYQGEMVLNTTTGKPVWATGSTAGSVWKDATGTLAHTPA